MSLPSLMAAAQGVNDVELFHLLLTTPNRMAREPPRVLISDEMLRVGDYRNAPFDIHAYIPHFKSSGPISILKTG